MPLNSETQYNDYASEASKLEAVLQNPAVLTVFSINCDLFSLGKVLVKDANGEVIRDHPLNQILNNPNAFQSKRQLLWDYMFWTMLGNANLYIDSKVDTEANKLYFLNNSKVRFSQKMMDKADRLFMSKSNVNQFKNSKIEYRYSDGTKTTLDYEKILHFTDLTTSTNAWFKGSSKLDALFKVISNSELALDAKNVGLLYSGKYMISGKVGANDTKQLMMLPGDKEDAERKALSKKPVSVVPNMIEIKRFVEDLKKLDLDNAFINDAHSVGRIFNIPKEIIDAGLEGTTYENQEKATGRHVDYVLMPKGNDFVDGLMNYFGFDGEAEMSWEHLPFTYFRRVQEQSAAKTKAETFRILIESGVSAEDACLQCGYEFKNDVNYEQVRNTTSTARSGQNEG